MTYTVGNGATYVRITWDSEAKGFRMDSTEWGLVWRGERGPDEAIIDEGSIIAETVTDVIGTLRGFQISLPTETRAALEAEPEYRAACAEKERIEVHLEKERDAHDERQREWELAHPVYDDRDDRGRFKRRSW